MTKLVAISYEHFSNKRWKAASSFNFAHADSVCPLTITELPKACLTLPIAFLPLADSSFSIAALQGLRSNENLFIGSDGSWLNAYVPAPYRGYPFLLATAEDGREVLCIDEDSGTIGNSNDGEPFFDFDSEQPTKKLQELLDYLSAVSNDRKNTSQLCAILKKHSLIVPWNLTLSVEGKENSVKGLYRIDESKIAECNANQLLELRDAGAFPVIYCQLLSMQHTSRLESLLSQKLASEVAKNYPELNFDLSGDSGNISFSDL